MRECNRCVDVTWQMAMLRKKYDDLVTFTVRHHSHRSYERLRQSGRDKLLP